MGSKSNSRQALNIYFKRYFLFAPGIFLTSVNETF